MPEAATILLVDAEASLAMPTREAATALPARPLDRP
jgi:hypothetical protein